MGKRKSKLGDGYAIALAWPETNCKQAGAWYDPLMRLLRFNVDGYYRVGHAAVVLIDDVDRRCRYFDFGRYHAPANFGRVRNARTDHDLKISTKAQFDPETKGLLNLHDILMELAANPSTHGTGTIYGSVARINYTKGMEAAQKMQEADFIPYGPFVKKGSNCSRFVNNVLKKSVISSKLRFQLRIPWMLTPTPLYNVLAVNHYASSDEHKIMWQEGIAALKIPEIVPLA